LFALEHELQIPLHYIRGHGSNKASSFNGHGQGDPRVTLDQENADTHLASKSDPMISVIYLVVIKHKRN